MQVTTYTAMSPGTTFVYPSANEYSFDVVCTTIVRKLEKRNWRVPGLQVEFIDSGTGEQKYRNVYCITGEDFKLWFTRIQGMINGWTNDTAAVASLTIPQRELHVYEDRSGPTYYTYVGEDWEKDKEAFMNGGECRCEYSGTSSGGFSLESRYGEPTNISIQRVFEDFSDWLTENVLRKVESVPAATHVETTAEPEIPYSQHLGPFYIKIEGSTPKRIRVGKENKSLLAPSDRYVLPSGWERLISLDVKNDGSVPKEAYDAFQYCTFQRPALERLSDRRSPVAILKIQPQKANGIFIVDTALGEKYRQRCFEASGKEWLSSEEYHEFKRCVGRTMLPIHLYNGNYESPLILIRSGRELSFDEVDIVEQI